jgi:hypothetical protein
VRIGDCIGVPLLITAPWPHCEQIKTRGSDMAVAPRWPQEGQAIRVNMAVTAYSIGLAGRSLPKFLLPALYQRCNNRDILCWWLVSFEPGRLLPPCRISRAIGIQRMGLVARISGGRMVTKRSKAFGSAQTYLQHLSTIAEPVKPSDRRLFQRQPKSLVLR